MGRILNSFLVARYSKQIKCYNGEVLFFEDFFKEYFSKFYAFAMRFIENSHVCEDIVQDTFISIWEGKGEYESILMFHAYIYKTIRNKALNYLKHSQIKKQYSQTYLQEVESEKFVVESVLEEETHFVLYEAIRQLTPQCQNVIKLHLEGKSNKEIAEEMQLSIVTVKSHKIIAYNKLREILKNTSVIVMFFLKKNLF